jgi:hypothetical protein
MGRPIDRKNATVSSRPKFAKIVFTAN